MHDAEPLPAGKLPANLLQRLLGTLVPDESVVVGPGVGRDAAVIRLGNRLLVLKTDPITFATDEIGWYTVNVNANDLACMGATPRWLLVSALLPAGSTTEKIASQIFDDLRGACLALDVALVGGHTEITPSVDRPILVGQMVGETTADRLIDPRRARAGDVVILARGIAIEGTSLLARELPAALLAGFDRAFLDRCRGFLHDPGISVLAAAEAIAGAVGADLHALHDPTEGGLATGLRELGAASGLGIAVHRDAIAVYPETAVLCRALGLDPLGLIASGALLAVVAPAAAERALAALASVGIDAAAVGSLEPDPARQVLYTATGDEPLPAFAVDEIARLFAALDSGG
ncbi:MAG TPA: AIR synthase related protein [Thermomicrobiaceae bacterium]|nr:AIR synthase related protein [Thermomicrobiaceae bacterium]